MSLQLREHGLSCRLGLPAGELRALPVSSAVRADPLTRTRTDRKIADERQAEARRTGARSFASQALFTRPTGQLTPVPSRPQ